jgi:hypothetical protein
MAIHGHVTRARSARDRAEPRLCSPPGADRASYTYASRPRGHKPSPMIAFVATFP